MSSNPQLTPDQLNYAQTAQWKQIIRAALTDLRVAIPCIVQSFDAETQTVSVQIAIREVVRMDAGPQDVAIQPINNVPVCFPSAGGFSVTLPVQEGDEGLLVFCDMCIDLWWTRGDVQNQFERRRHDLSDCEFWPGGRSKPNALQNYSEDTIQIRNDDGTAFIEIDGDGAVNIKAPGGINIQTEGEDVTIDAGGGTLEVAGDAVIDGVDIKTHAHSGVTTGGGTSGPPV